jgi:hypothetical protein
MYVAVLAIANRGGALDTITLKNELANRGRLEDVGGPAYIAGLLDGLPRSVNAEHYATLVRQLAATREGIRICEETKRVLYDDPAAISNGLGSRHSDAWSAAIERAAVQPKPALKAFTMREIRSHTFPPRRAILYRRDSPVFRAGHLSQWSGMRGIGKSQALLTVGIAAATGTDAMGFSAPEPVPTLLIDGEMAGEDQKGRCSHLASALNVLDTDNLVLLGADWQDEYGAFLPRLDTLEGQAAVEPYIESAELVIIDNRSCLFDPEGEKDPAAWQPAQDWLLSLRRRGKAVIVAHHANRLGGSRGHSKPEDVMNLIVSLTRPDDWKPEDGARFTLTFDKTRGVHGSAVASFTTRLTSSGWLIEESDDGSTNIAMKLREHMQLAAGAHEWPKSANAAIRAAGVNRNGGLKAWADMLKRGEIVQRPEGGFECA